MFRLDKKKALITGASGGIGSACANLFAALGASLILSGTNEQKLQNTRSEILQSHKNANIDIAPCDLADLNATENLIDSLTSLDILVCNAGITKDGLSMRMNNKDFENVLNINLMASFVLNRSAIKKMISARYGRIVNITSVVGVSGNAGQANYSASKAGLIGMSKSLAQEVATRNVTINCVAPGFIQTNMTSKLSEAQIAAIIAKIPSKTLGTPEDIANTVAFLCSSEAKYITGQTIHVNGGMYMI
ncbi:MAG: 3-oxoacyl-ACP reductase FabG [Rickettsiaceae bacterium]|nr:3-oxoacyl-ACP reductase FabG [Rickettsiaceae bacterium]